LSDSTATVWIASERGPSRVRVWQVASRLRDRFEERLGLREQ
jgi:hypothetical protein